MSVTWAACFRILKQNSEKRRNITCNGQIMDERVKQHFRVNVSICDTYDESHFDRNRHIFNHLIRFCFVHISRFCFFITCDSFFLFSLIVNIWLKLWLFFIESGRYIRSTHYLHALHKRFQWNFFLSFPLHAPVYGFLFWLCEFLLRIKDHNVLFFCCCCYSPIPTQVYGSRSVSLLNISMWRAYLDFVNVV